MTVVAYRNKETGDYPVTADQVRRSVDFLFGPDITASVLTAAGMVAVNSTEQPVFDPAIHVAVEVAPAERNGKWYQAWEVRLLPPPPTPESVSPLQFRTALRRFGVKDKFDAFVATLDDEGRDAVEYATSINRADPLIENARLMMGWTHSQVDELFRVAGSITRN